MPTRVLQDQPLHIAHKVSQNGNEYLRTFVEQRVFRITISLVHLSCQIYVISDYVIDFKTRNFVFIANLSHHCPRILEILMSFLYAIRYQMKYRITAICVPRFYSYSILFYIITDICRMTTFFYFVFVSVIMKKTPVAFLHIRKC